MKITFTARVCHGGCVSRGRPGHIEERSDMDGVDFDRLAKLLAGSSLRRTAVRVAAGAGLTALVARFGGDAAVAKNKKKRKKRCRKFGQTCGKKKCCKTNGPAKCQQFGNQECFGVELSGKRCCGLEGARCNPNFGDPGLLGNCSCCHPLFCGQQPNGQFRCQTEDT